LLTETRAVVDVGSNTVHLLVARWDGRRLCQVSDSSRRSGLAKDLQHYGAISDSRLRVLGPSIQAMVQRARAYGAHDIQLLGTEAIRVARNRADAVAGLARATGLPVRVLATNEEAYLAAVGAALRAPWHRSALVVDIGGASIQLALASERAVEATCRCL
jgi:exopolyphosphatase/guanosine-5'-triphosphate,3'-diphosphate pyrophosphatase